MPRLTTYTDKSTPELIDLYELCCTDLSNLHRELSQIMAELHSSYLEAYASSRGKSVAERNRDADYSTNIQYREVLDMRGQINSLTVQRDMITNLINWKSDIRSNESTQLTTYPPNFDSERIGHGK